MVNRATYVATAGLVAIVGLLMSTHSPAQARSWYAYKLKGRHLAALYFDHHARYGNFRSGIPCPPRHVAVDPCQQILARNYGTVVDHAVFEDTEGYLTLRSYRPD